MLSKEWKLARLDLRDEILKQLISSLSGETETDSNPPKSEIVSRTTQGPSGNQESQAVISDFQILGRIPKGMSVSETSANGIYSSAGSTLEDSGISYRYLPFFHRYRRYNRLSHIRIKIINASVQDDEKMFRDLREQYQINRGKLRQLFSVWRLECVQIVRLCSIFFIV